MAHAIGYKCAIRRCSLSPLRLNYNSGMNSRIILASLVLFCMVQESGGQTKSKINYKTWLNPKVRSMKVGMHGPYVRLDKKRILVLEQNATRISSDSGKTWSKPTPVFKDPKRYKVNAPALIRTQQGALVLAFINQAEMVWKWNDKRRDADPGTKLPTYVTRSLDDGRTWAKPQKLHDEWTGDLRNIIQTRKGTIIFSSMQLWNNPGRHVMLTYSSSDNGATWKRSNFIDLGGNGHHDGAVEGTIVELKDGRIWMLIRTNWDYFWEAFSNDQGKSWRVIRPSKIQASSSPGLLKRLKSGRLVLFYNRLMPTGWKTYPRMGGINGRMSPQWSLVPASASREELSMVFSDDDGKSWTKPVVVAARDDQVSYPVVFEIQPGTMWVTSGYGKLRAVIREKDFMKK